MSGMTMISGNNRPLGPRFAFMVIGSVTLPILWFGLYTWLAHEIDWPDAYGIQCRRRCALDYLWHSPALLHDGKVHALGLFAMLWTIPAAIAGFLLFQSVKKRSGNPISSQNPTE